jgi:hypothetical protein
MGRGVIEEVAVPGYVVGGGDVPGVVDDSVFTRRAVACSDVAPVVFDKEFF